ncbi:hypothetical protein B0O99DRAFT_690203 [Bisporella sp. PMI_857]|nr:hypothetical protein B0O99DRAFT_690203 [Bisporella sp. PMI_857]
MVPKHGLSSTEDSLPKRLRSSETLASRSATPAEINSTKPNFKVHYHLLDLNHKQPKTDKELGKHAKFLVSPFAEGAKAGELDQYFPVEPIQDWEIMKKYNNFVIEGDTYTKYHFVYVRLPDTPNTGSENDQDFGVARILQIRALNSQNVYALVAWMWWAKELPAPLKRAPDQMFLTFAGKADVVHWNEEDDQLSSKFYWRQTLNRTTGELSQIRERCICKGHFNPEIAMEICDNPSCKVWLHDECIINDILTKTYNRLQTNGETNGTSKSRRKSKGKIWKRKFSAKIKADSVSTTVEIADLRKDVVALRPWEERVACLKCGTLLDGVGILNKESSETQDQHDISATQQVRQALNQPQKDLEHSEPSTSSVYPKLRSFLQLRFCQA